MKIGTFETHPACDLMPLLDGEDLRSLADSIRRNGQRLPILLADGKVLDGRNRLRACLDVGVEPRFEDWRGEGSPFDFVWDTNSERRHLEQGQKAALKIKFLRASEEWQRERRKSREKANESRSEKQEGKPKQRGSPRDERRSPERTPDRHEHVRVAQAAGVSPKTAERALSLEKKAPELFEKVASGEVSLARAVKMANAEAEKADLEKAAREVSVDPESALIEHCSMQELIRPGLVVDHIISDPPYPEEFVGLYGDLAKAAAKVLPPHGVLAVMCGQSYLPRIIADMSQYLTYRWTIAYLTPGGQAVQLWDRKVNTFWKPVLLFGATAEWIGDVAESRTNDNDKRFHKWGQSVSGMVRLVESLTKPGERICDPFMGAGTTGVAALALSRRFVGCDVDAAQVAIARGRIAEVVRDQAA